MSVAVATVPVQITPEALALADERGYRAELEAMIAKAPELYAKLVAIRVTRLEAFPETHDHEAILLAFHQADVDPRDISEDLAYGRWRRVTFPPEVLAWFTYWTTSGHPTDGR